MTTREVRERKRPAPSPQTPCNRLHAVGEMKPVESLQRANRHARRRSPAEVDKLADFLTDHDVRLPILATADGRVVFGHHILEAYLKLQRLEVPVIEVDGWPDARLKHVEMTLEGYFASGEWDDETVKDYIEDIFQYDPALFSTSWFSNGEIDLFLNKGGKETT
ncbi:MAG: hypothetical protein ACXU8S_03240, partial [Phenylobacterium sp.]